MLEQYAVAGVLERKKREALEVQHARPSARRCPELARSHTVGHRGGERSLSPQELFQGTPYSHRERHKGFYSLRGTLEVALARAQLCGRQHAGAFTFYWCKRVVILRQLLACPRHPLFFRAYCGDRDSYYYVEAAQL
jgi:hypothetical protein